MRQLQSLVVLNNLETGTGGGRVPASTTETQAQCGLKKCIKRTNLKLNFNLKSALKKNNQTI